jgi:hypothetical protein
MIIKYDDIQKWIDRTDFISRMNNAKVCDYCTSLPAGICYTLESVLNHCLLMIKNRATGGTIFKNSMILLIRIIVISLPVRLFCA